MVDTTLPLSNHSKMVGGTVLMMEMSQELSQMKFLKEHLEVHLITAPICYFIEKSTKNSRIFQPGEDNLLRKICLREYKLRFKPKEIN